MMALSLFSKQILNKTLSRMGPNIMSPAPVLVHNLAKRSQSIDASAIIKRSPYEEVNAYLDSKSSKENPMKINAYGDERTIACVCDDMHFMTLKKGPPVKCKCGYWFQLVDAEKFWEKEKGSS